MEVIFDVDVINFALDVSGVVDRAKQQSKADTVKVPPDAKPLLAAAQRALADAEERERAAQAASGTDRAS